MIRVVCLVLCLFLVSFYSASAQQQFCGQSNTLCWDVRPTNPGVGLWGFNKTTKTFEAYNGTNWSGLSQGVIDVSAFGAKCDAVTNDAPAINAATAAQKAVQFTGPIQGSKLIFPGNKRCRITSTLDFSSIANVSGYRSIGAEIDGNGTSILCAVNNAPCIYAMGSAGMHWHDLSMMSDPSCVAGQTPTVGMQIGRIGSAGPSASSFINVTIDGCFSTATYYNLASEGVNWVNAWLRNTYKAGGAGAGGVGVGGYAVILDGINHWQMPTFFGQVQTAPPDVAISFNGDTFYSGTIQQYAVTGTLQPAMWISGTMQLEMFDTYVATNGACGIDLFYFFNDYFANNNNSVFSIHVEAFPGLQNVFCFRGNGTTLNPIIRNFKHNLDGATQAANSILWIDPASGIQTITMYDADIKFTSPGLSTKVFDDSTKWSMTGSVSVPDISQFTFPISFSGTLCDPVNGCVNYPKYKVGNKSLCLYGDSIMFNSDQFSAGPTYIAEPTGGPGSWINWYSSYRVMRAPYTNNLGVAGDKTSDMLARLTTVVNAHCDVVVMNGGTNDVGGTDTCTTTTNNLRTIILKLLQTGTIVIDTTIFPRPSAAWNAADTAMAICINNWRRTFAAQGSGLGSGVVNGATAQAGSTTLISQTGYYLVDLDPVMTDMSAATWTIKTGYLQNDGVHPSTAGGSAMGYAIAQIINQLVPSWLSPMVNGSEVYDGTNNPRGNLLPNGTMQGAGGVVAGCTGTLPNSMTSSENYIAVGGTCNYSIVTLSNGVRAVQIDLTGNPGTPSRGINIAMAVATPNAKITTGDTIRGLMWVQLQPGEINLNIIQPSTLVIVGAVTTANIGAASPVIYPWPAEGFAPTYSFGGENWIPIMTPVQTVSGAPTTVTFNLGMTNMAAALTNATVKVCCWEIRKVIP